MPSLAVRLGDLATRIATEAKALRTLINGNAADLSALTTTAKSSLVAACNELQAEINAAAATAGAAAVINDASGASATQTYSINKILDVVNSAITVLTTGAPGALNTLDELAAALGDDANFAATITAALASRVRTDTAAQGLTDTQKGNARTNIGAQASAEIGNTDADLVATFEAGLI